MSIVVAVSASPTHSFSKSPVPEITLLAGLGVHGDAHCGASVRHRYRVRQNPSAPNLCQVHLLQQELFPELAALGFPLSPGQLGENILTRGLDLLHLPLGTRLHLGPDAIVEVTGLRDPCNQMNGLQPGLMKACLARDPQTGATIRKSGIMSIVLAGGIVHPGDPIRIELPTTPHRPLGPV